MKFNNFKYADMHTMIPSIKNSVFFAFLISITLLVTSCSSTQGVSDSDGIYNSTPVVVVEETPSENKNNYYKQYFKSKSQSIDEIPEEDVIFTDIESYTTSETVDDSGNIVIQERGYEEGYGAWGNNGENITINIYDNAGFGWNNWGWGLGWNNWGWGLGWNRWGAWGPGWGGWGLGWNGWGWGGFYNNPWYCAPLYGGFYNGYNPYYGYAANYNRGRSNLAYNRSNGVRGRSNVRGRSSAYSRSEAVRRSSRSNRSVNRTSTSRSRVNRGNTNRTRVNRGNTRTTRPNTRATRSNTRTTRPSNRSVNRSRSYSRPSSRGASRSSGGASRGGGRRGRG